MENSSRPLTSRQQEVLDLIRRRVRETRLPPTVREIGDTLDIRSTNGVRVILDALVKKGYLRRSPRLSRGLSVVDMDNPAITGDNPDDLPAGVMDVPLLGKVAAGNPLLALESREDLMRIPAGFVRAGADFALKVQGDSMIEAGILPGDVIFARQQSTARKGEIVIALLGDEATVKTYYPEGDRIRLQPENARLEPIWVESHSPEFRILGRVTGVFRSLGH